MGRREGRVEGEKGGEQSVKMDTMGDDVLCCF